MHQIIDDTNKLAGSVFNCETRENVESEIQEVDKNTDKEDEYI